MHIVSSIRLLTEMFILHENDYFVFFLFNVSMVFLGALLFIVGWKYYIHMDAYDSVITNCFPVYRNAFKVWRQYKKDQRSRGTQRMRMISLTRSSDNNSARFNNEEQEEIRRDHQSFRFLDYAKINNHGNFNDRIVDDVKSFQSAIFIFILTLPYWLIFAQVEYKKI